MTTNRFEQFEYEEQRYSERLMVFNALRRRRHSFGPRRLLSSFLWIVGSR